jgi:GT2 family glycosyltransferase
VTDRKSDFWNDTHSIFDGEIENRPILEDVSIVIPTLGRDILEQCLYWIIKGSAWPGCLIVVNQGPEEKVETWLQHLQSIGIKVKHIPSQQRGRSAGVNRGLENVETTFVAITDDDCFVDAEWLKHLAAKMRQNPSAIVTGRVEAAGDAVIVVVTSTSPAVYRRPRLKFDSMSGGNMGTSIAVVKKVGLFDEDPCMQTAEDAEWSYRALRKGVTIFYDPQTCLWHYGWRDLENRAKQYRHYALSHGGFYGKYLRKGDLFIFVRAFLHVLRAMRRWFKGRVSGDNDLALLGKSYFLNLFPGILAGLRSHRQPDGLA